MVDVATRETNRLVPDDAASAADHGAAPAPSAGRRERARAWLEGASPPAGELIEPGRALAIADFAPPTLGAGERLIRMAYRAGIPASMLTLPIGRKSRPRILAAVTNPLRGDAAAGKALRAGHFLVHGVKTGDIAGRFSRRGAA